MLIGDPYSFAIRCDVVEAWNNSTFWINGIFEIYIYGKKYPNVLCETEFRTNISFLISGFQRDMKALPDKFFDKIDSELLNSDLYNYFVSSKLMINLESSEMDDLGVNIIFFFNNKNDFIALFDKGDFELIQYNKGEILDIIQRFESIGRKFIPR